MAAARSGVLFISIIVFALHHNPLKWAFGRYGKVRLGEVGCLTQKVMEPQCLPGFLDKGDWGAGLTGQHFQGKWAEGSMSYIFMG